MKDLEELKDKIVRYRAKYNLTQQEFADKCKVSFTTINKIENNKASISKLTYAKIENIVNKL